MGMPITDYDFIRHNYLELLRQFTYRTDQERHGVEEYWSGDAELVADLKDFRFEGDCEEFARACLLKLRERINVKVRLVVCRDETGAGHCVCEVSSLDNKEAYILDNRQQQLMAFDKLKGYTFYYASPWNPMPADKRPWLNLKR